MSMKPNIEMFENIAYIMAKHTDPSIPDSALGSEHADRD